MRAAGVGGHVAADGARLLRRRVGRVVQPEVRDLAAEVEVEHAGLDPRDPLVGVDLEHAVQLGGDDDQRVVDGCGAAGEAGAAPPGHERPVVPRRDAHRGGDLVARAREAHDRGAPARDARVARVERELERLGARRSGPRTDCRSARSARVSSMVTRLRRAVAYARHLMGKATHNGTSSTTDRTAAGPREWVTFADPATKVARGRSTSRSCSRRGECIFGCGCQGIWTAPTPELVHGCCTYGAHFTDKADRDHVAKVAKTLDADEWQFAKIGRKKGIYAKVGTNPTTSPSHRVEDPGRRRRLHLPQPARLRRRSRLRAAPARAQHRRALQRVEARGLLAGAAAAHRRRAGRRHRDLPPHRVRPRRLGRGRRGLRLVVHRGARGVHSAPEPVYESMEVELRKMLGKKLYTAGRRLPRRPRGGTTARRRSTHPAEVPVTLGARSAERASATG